MSEDTNTNQGGTGAAVVAGTAGVAGATGSKKSSQPVTNSDGIITDKNKSPEKYMDEAEDKYIIPSLVREKFPDLVKLIYETESMNQEEREYWMQIMPIMTEEQILKFREILVNEKEQLEKLDKEYEQEMSRINQKYVKEIDEEEMKKKITQIKTAEAQSQQKEEDEEAALLNQIENL